MLGIAKDLIQRYLSFFGYQIVALKEPVQAPINLLELLLRTVRAERADFCFVQVGANDGVKDDPLRRFVSKYRWRGVLVEPQPQVFEKLVKNYEAEKQLVFENVAIDDADGTARLFVADSKDESANLTVFASLKKDALHRGLKDALRRGLTGQETGAREIEVQALSVRSLLRKHNIKSLDLLLTDVQGYDCEVVNQFLDCGVKPTIVHFEHCHTDRSVLSKLYRRLVSEGYRLIELDVDTLCLNSNQGETAAI
jgi:FkbM family methyltransferase